MARAAESATVIGAKLPSSPVVAEMLVPSGRPTTAGRSDTAYTSPPVAAATLMRMRSVPGGSAPPVRSMPSVDAESATSASAPP